LPRQNLLHLGQTLCPTQSADCGFQDLLFGSRLDFRKIRLIRRLAIRAVADQSAKALICQFLHLIRRDLRCNRNLGIDGLDFHCRSSLRKTETVGLL